MTIIKMPKIATIHPWYAVAERPQAAEVGDGADAGENVSGNTVMKSFWPVSNLTMIGNTTNVPFSSWGCKSYNIVATCQSHSVSRCHAIMEACAIYSKHVVFVFWVLENCTKSDFFGNEIKIHKIFTNFYGIKRDVLPSVSPTWNSFPWAQAW